MAKFDKLDRDIMVYLQQDGRMQSSKIADRLQISERTVRNRIDRLVKNHAIHPTIVVNWKAFGYQTAVDIFLEVELPRMNEIGEALRQQPEVNYIAFSTGDQDISIQAVLKSNDDLQNFIQRLSEIPGIRRTKTVLVPRINKHTHDWIPPIEDFHPYIKKEK